MNFSDINWDFKSAGGWPLPIKAGTIGFVCLLVAGAVAYYDTMPQLEDLEKLENEEHGPGPDGLRAQFASKQAEAINLDNYKAQLKEIEASLGEMVKQMPTKAEVASLLIDISQTGLANGLEFKLFQPRDEVPKDIYTELPIDIIVTGKFVQLGAFVSGLASLPRVVTVHDITIVPLASANAANAGKAEKTEETRLQMNATIKTYNEQSSATVKDADTKMVGGGL